MAISIDKKRTALLCLHFQNDIVNEDGALARAGFTTAGLATKLGVLTNTARLQKAARAAGVKVFHVGLTWQPDFSDAPKCSPLVRACVEANSLVEGTWGADFAADVGPRGDDEIVFNKATGAFTTSDLRERLKTADIKMLLLAGVATNFVVESTAREGSDLGYEVVVVRDCCNSVSQEMHEAALSTALPMLATIAESAEVVALLDRNPTEPLNMHECPPSPGESRRSRRH